MIIEKESFGSGVRRKLRIRTDKAAIKNLSYLGRKILECSRIIKSKIIVDVPMC
jgi:hypothetical protein